MGNQSSSEDNAFDDIVLPSKPTQPSTAKACEPAINIKELWIYPVKVSENILPLIYLLTLSMSNHIINL
jgi:hypothetical protein